MAANAEIKRLLTAMGFALEEGAAGVWAKEYPIHGYRLRVDVNKEEILYGDKITLGDKTTCNFKASENFVVLECVDRLLEQGYAPEHLHLEKDYPLGHKEKGKLDILVNDKDGKAFLMIECKTWGGEYEKATRKTLGKGGQLLSYFQQDKAARYLCLYTSRLEDGNIERAYGVIKVEDEFATATNTEEVFELWNKNLRDNGVFEGAPYDIIIKALTKERLKPLTREDSSRIFNQFAEILRHNVVSDKPNAFNKLITLLLCKIVDEEKGDGEELDFQWREDDTNIALQKRLNDLYKYGMDRYLTKKVTDYSDEDVDDIVGISEAAKEEVKRMITELRLKKNNEFAFKEVFNDASFEDNSKVLREVVELLQPYQMRYNKKHQFLGDFFELLLNTSIKQEAGQFFTPVPVARFIINSIPLREMMVKKIEAGDADFLPYVIDYAVGSGHFLTEAMDQMHAVVKEIFASGKYNKPAIKKNLAKWSEDYDWAYDFVYGIEKDYRLVKTAKVSCFLNGDGLARIFNADGLANFQTDADYKDKLKEVPNKAVPQDNSQFEVLIANPPYSVSAFRNTLKEGDKSFELYGRLTEDSSEIECLFIERAKQLLKPGGYAGIILPSSILSNTGIYEDARAIILKYFRVVAITEFGSGTFMATGTNTVTLFLERRTNADWQKIEHAVKTFFTNTTDVTVNGIDAAFSAYAAHVYKTISLEDYASFVRQKPNAAILAHELFVDYRKAFDTSTPVKNLRTKRPFKALPAEEQQVKLDELFYADVLKREQEKLLYFLLAYPQRTLLVKSNPTGKNEAEKEFLGYEFSNRRGHEGIKSYGAKTIQEATKLYDEGTSLNPEKVNTYIYKAFLGEDAEVTENLQGNVNYQRLVDMMSFERVEFSKSVSLAVKKKLVDYAAIWGTENLVQLSDVAAIQKGTSITKAETLPGKVPVIAGGKEAAYLHNVANRTGDVITVSASGASAGFVNFFTENIFASDCNTIQSKDEKAFPTKLLFHMLKQLQPVITDAQRGQAQPHVYAGDLEGIKIPLLKIPSQIAILDELQAVSEQETDGKLKLANLGKDLQNITKHFFSKSSLLTKIEEIADFVQYGISSEMNRGKNGYKIFRMNEIIGGRMRDNGEMKYADISPEDFEKFRLQKGDILFNRTNSPELVGKTGLFDLDGEYCFASYLVRLRVDRNKAIPEFVNLMMNSDTFQTTAKAAAVRAVKQANINAEKLKGFSVPLPSIDEQKAVAAQITDIEAKIAQLQYELAKLPQKKEDILQKHL